MSFEYFIGRRYLRTKRKHAFITLITFLSIAGVTVGVMALIVVIAVMTGAQNHFRTHILGAQAHIIVKSHTGSFSGYPSLIENIETCDGVEAATPFILTQVMLRSSSGVSGAILRGINPETAGKVIKIFKDDDLTVKLKEHASENPSGVIPGIILGKELANNLGVDEGDMIYLISPQGIISPAGHMPSMKRFEVTGFFKSGLYDYDGSFAYIHLQDAQKLLRMDDSVSGMEVRVHDIYKAPDVAKIIVEKIGFPFWAVDWMQMNRNLFSALKLEKIAMFIILTLIVLVAAFNIASSLIMMVMAKTKDIAILKAMGATDKSIRKIFVFNGMIIGSVGTFLGISLGFLVCVLLKRYKIIELPGDIYYFTTLPIQLEAMDVVLIAAAAIAICYLATLYPAYQASKLNPVEAIRYG